MLSDVALSLSGIDAVEQPRSRDLAELALGMAAKGLKGGGNALIKVSQGAGFQELIQDARGPRQDEAGPAGCFARSQS